MEILQYIKVFCKKFSSNSLSAYQFVNKFSGKTKSYSKHQNFNCDETGLYIGMLLGYFSISTQPARWNKKSQRQGNNKCLYKCQWNNKVTFIIDW